MPNVLNPRLYVSLERAFGSVLIMHAGVKRVEAPASRMTPGKRQKPLVFGEEYRVCCPFCGDSRHRLHISYTWSLRYSGRFCCYNEHCETSPDNRRALYRKLESGSKIRVCPPVRRPEKKRPIALPGVLTPLTSLPPEHPAIKYVMSKNYDPATLTNAYGVGYCEYSAMFFAKNRLVAPIYRDETLVGWQARMLEAPKSKSSAPKWYSCPGMQKSSILYNHNGVRRYNMAILVEGPADVWRVGPMAAAYMGSYPSVEQGELIRSMAPSVCVCLPDGDIFDGRHEKLAEAYEAFVSQMNAKGLPTVLLKLPPDKDPGDLGRPFLHRFIAEGLKVAGHPADWRPRV